MIALVHFGAIFAYLTNPAFLRWSAFAASEMVRWIGVVLSCFGMAGEIWAAVSLGASYSPTLRIADERVVVTAGPYRWIRHPLDAFWLPVMLGCGGGYCGPTHKVACQFEATAFELLAGPAFTLHDGFVSAS